MALLFAIGTVFRVLSYFEDGYSLNRAAMALLGVVVTTGLTLGSLKEKRRASAT